MSAVLSASDLVKIYGSRRVLDGVSLAAAPGQRIGLVGENGAGKSTLLRLLAGLIEPDGGTVNRAGPLSGTAQTPPGARQEPTDVAPDLGFLHQELPHPGHATVGDVVDDALAQIREVQRRLDQLAAALQHRPDDPAALAAYGETLQWATDHELWDADRRADLVLAGLGLAGAGPPCPGPERTAGRQRRRRTWRCDRPVGTLSGGERSRLGLAALLIRQPRTLLLDEPTNHLDDAAIEFVQAHLARLPGAVVLASHDRVFLDAVCTEIVDLDPSRGGPVRYGGSYSEYLRAKRTERRRWQEQYEAEQAELATLRRAVATTARQVAPNRGPRDGDKMGYDYHGGRVQSQISRRVRNAQRRLDELTRGQVRKPPAPLTFQAALTSNGHRDGVAASLRGVRIPGRLRVDHLDLPAAGRLLVTGPNGAGKSTLLAVLAGQLTPAAGTVTHQRGLRVGLLEQDVSFADPAATPRRLYAAASERSASGASGQAAAHGDTAAASERSASGASGQAAAHGNAADRVPRARVPLTELGLVAPRDLDRPVGELSVGQRRRLALALLVADPPQLLLLDEPTNHISLALAEELEQALQTAPGAVVAASHDRWLRRRWDGPTLRITAEHRTMTA